MTPHQGPPPVDVEPAYGVPARPFATISVPRWTGIGAQPIAEGITTTTVLDVVGVGHYPGTAMPGAVGNFAIAGHRTTYGKPFNKIADLRIGDAIIIQTPTTWYVYTVTSTQVVAPSAMQVIAPVPGQIGVAPTARMITLTSCTPMYSAASRYVVHGVLKYWAPVAGSAVPAELLADPSPPTSPAPVRP